MRPTKLSLALSFLILALVVACNSQKTVPKEYLGKTSQDLLILGAPCLLGEHCDSGFCVDAVCCENACLNGERDNFSCSNVYGTVAGLVSGRCTELQPGDACGKLESFSPCKWRGTTLNGGHKCPNPNAGDPLLTCFGCGAGQTCPDGVPVCNAGECVGCNGDFNDPNPLATNKCPTQAAPACVNGACLQCSGTNSSACVIPKPICDVPNHVCIGCNTFADCSGTTPVCNTSACVPCQNHNGTGLVDQCPTSADPVCLPNGDCVECTPALDDKCTGTKPVCDPASNTCVGCLGPADCQGALGVCDTNTHTCVAGCTTDGNCAAPTPVCLNPPGGFCVACTAANPTFCTNQGKVCDTVNNVCVGCLTSATCPAETPICDPVTKTCTATCTLSSQCPADTPVCNPASHVCVECVDNTTCTAAPNLICNPTTGTCGTECTLSTQCPADTPVCNPVLKVCVECLTNANCTLPEVCDPVTGTCGPCTTNAQCPGDTPICNPVTKKCVECTTNANCTPPEVCDTTTNTCGPCTTNAQCPGDTPICNPTTKVCVQCIENANCPGDKPICDPPSGKCTTDCTTSAQCPGDTPVCNPATKKCVDCLTNGDCPAATPVCNTTTHTCEPAKPGTTPQSIDDEFNVQGAGCDCSTTSKRESSTPIHFGLGLGLALAAFARRRKTDRTRSL